MPRRIKKEENSPLNTPEACLSVKLYRVNYIVSKILNPSGELWYNLKNVLMMYVKQCNLPDGDFL